MLLRKRNGFFTFHVTYLIVVVNKLQKSTKVLLRFREATVNVLTGSLTYITDYVVHTYKMLPEIVEPPLLT